MNETESPSLLLSILHFLVAGGLGLISASVANSFGWRSADRLPGESRWPMCVYCLRPFTWQEASPLVGWLLRPGTVNFPCPCGRRKGLWQQPAVEVMGLLLGLIGMAVGGWSWQTLALCIGLGLLPAIAMIDLYFGIIPDELNIAVALLGLAWVGLGGRDVYIALMIGVGLMAIGLFGALVYSRWRGKEMLGLGDVKFFAAAGIWLDPQLAPWFLVLGGFTGAAVGILWEKSGGGKESPFGPSLCFALAVCVLYQVWRM